MKGAGDGQHLCQKFKKDNGKVDKKKCGDDLKVVCGRKCNHYITFADETFQYFVTCFTAIVLVDRNCTENPPNRWTCPSNRLEHKMNLAVTIFDENLQN